MICYGTAVFSEDKLLFSSYEEFAAQGIEKFVGKTLAFVNVEYRKYGTKIHTINLITVSTLTVAQDGNINLSDLVMASASPDVLLPEQKPEVHKWLMTWVPKEAWHRTNRFVKRTIS